MVDRGPQHVAIGRAVRRLRTERGLSQEQLALEAGIHSVYLSGIERGHRNPSLHVLIALGEALGVRGSELVALAEEDLESHSP
jgi:transcriptional regulator with XRE-family HTH domain